jgi:ribosomal protein L22
MAGYTFTITKEMVAARTTASVSTLSAETVCHALNRKPFEKAHKIAENLVNEKVPLSKQLYVGKKFYTETSRAVLRLMDSVAANARNRNLDPATMTLYISAHNGRTLYRARRKRRFGIRMKETHIQAVLVKSGTKLAQPTWRQRTKK